MLLQQIFSAAKAYLIMVWKNATTLALLNMYPFLSIVWINKLNWEARNDREGEARNKIKEVGGGKEINNKEARK